MIFARVMVVESDAYMTLPINILCVYFTVF